MYKARYWWWESVLLLRRGVLIAIATSVDDFWTRNLTINLVLIVILVTHCLAQPFRLATANAAETFMLSLLVCISSTVMIPDTDVTSGMEWLRAVMLLTPAVMVVIATLHRVVRVLISYYKLWRVWKATRGADASPRSRNGSKEKPAVREVPLTPRSGQPNTTIGANSRPGKSSRKPRDTVNPLHVQRV